MRMNPKQDLNDGSTPCQHCICIDRTDGQSYELNPMPINQNRCGHRLCLLLGLHSAALLQYLRNLLVKRINIVDISRVSIYTSREHAPEPAQPRPLPWRRKSLQPAPCQVRRWCRILCMRGAHVKVDIELVLSRSAAKHAPHERLQRCHRTRPRGLSGSRARPRRERRG